MGSERDRWIHEFPSGLDVGGLDTQLDVVDEGDGLTHQR